MNSTDFTLVYDTIKTQKCLDCGNTFSPKEESDYRYSCDKCKSEQLISITYHDSEKCSFCEENIFAGNDAFLHLKTHKLMCITCFGEVFGEEAIEEWEL